MRTSPSSSSTNSTSITLESPQSVIGFLVLSVFGLRGRFGGRPQRGGVLIVRGFERIRLLVRGFERIRLLVRGFERIREVGGHDFLRHRQGKAEPRAADEG